MKRRSRLKGKHVERLDPLLGLYILVALHDSWESIQDAWHAVLSMERISGLLMTGEQPSYVREDELVRLRSQCSSDGIYTPPPKPKFKTGQRVKVGSGPFHGAAGEFVRAYGKGDELRAKISLASLGEADVKIGNLVAA